MHLDNILQILLNAYKRYPLTHAAKGTYSKPLKTSIFPDISTFLPPGTGCLSSVLHRLHEEESYNLFLLNALLEQRERQRPEESQGMMNAWLESGSGGWNHPEKWLQEVLALPSLPVRHVVKARRQAEAWLKQGIWAASCYDNCQDSQKIGESPQLVFGIGELSSEPPWIGVFNSRKHKTLLPHEDWLVALRAFLAHITSTGAGIASSVGTMTYDLASVHARREGSLLLTVLPFPMEYHFRAKGSPLLVDPRNSRLILSCATKAMHCTKPWSMYHRDRLLAAVSDVHLVLAVRPGGNMLRALWRQQAVMPRQQWIFHGRKTCRENQGNALLLSSFPGWARSFSIAAPATHSTPYREAVSEIHPIEWSQYLYHYTRPCPGPWPGESYEEYLLSLLRGDPESGHTAFDTLMRILGDGKIRGSKKLVRGDQAVVSLTSRSPLQLSAIRKWNPALIRWTVEPYGIAITKRALRIRGAKPAVYGDNTVYSKLKASDHFRFQLHKPPRCSWKHEKEWRFPGDISLGDIPVGDVLVFVSNSSEFEEIQSVSRRTYPVVALQHLSATPPKI